MKTEAEKEISLLSGLREREEGGGGDCGEGAIRSVAENGERREVILGKIRSNLCARKKTHQSITFSAAAVRCRNWQNKAFFVLKMGEWRCGGVGGLEALAHMRPRLVPDIN